MSNTPGPMSRGLLEVRDRYAGVYPELLEQATLLRLGAVQFLTAPTPEASLPVLEFSRDHAARVPTAPAASLLE